MHFCWLPPLRFRTRVLTPGVRIPRDRDVERNVLRQKATFGLAVFRQQHHAGANRGPRTHRTNIRAAQPV